MMLRKFEHECLVEALRRRQRFNDLKQSIDAQWTGLGTASTYKQAVQGGYMVVATARNPGHNTWWQLTEKGARVVAYWLGQGYTFERIEMDDIPQWDVPVDIL